MNKFLVMPYCPDITPLPRRWGFSFLSNVWHMEHRHGLNALNRVQPQRRSFNDRFGGIRLVRDLTGET